MEGRDLRGLVGELRQRIREEVALPPGYSVEFGGQFENQQRAQARLGIVVPMALGLIFLMLYFAFHSAGQALLIMLIVPFAAIGGIAVLNGVVMVNAIKQRVEGGMTVAASIVDRALSRLRPVLMTVTCTENIC